MKSKTAAKQEEFTYVVSVWQLVVASLPLFALFVYFLYQAYTRPSKDRYQPEVYEIDDDVTMKEVMAEPLIPLFDMLMVFLAFQVVFTIFLFYMLIFIARRHSLVRYYLSGERTETLLGDVYFKQPINRCDNRHFGYVVYKHPQSQGTVRKTTRIYLPYTREKTTIIKLIGRPYSGLSKADLEHDFQRSLDARHHIRRTSVFAFVWVLFLMLAPVYILVQLHKVDGYDEYENYTLARNIYIFGALIAVPVLCFLAVMLRWSLYRHWIVNRGRLEKDASGNTIDQDDQDEPIAGVFWTEMTSMKRDGEQNAPGFSGKQDEENQGAYHNMDNNKDGLMA